MIISASRRTDIPANYSEWLFNRIKEQYVCVRNPMNIHQVSRINLSPDVVDGIVFWTKNPTPMLSRLKELNDYMYYFQFTVTPYDIDVETAIPSKVDFIVPVFRKLSDIIGPSRMIWRYDPILLNMKYTINYHIEQYGKLASLLNGYTHTSTISFIDFYRNTENNIKSLRIDRLTNDDIKILAAEFSDIAQANHMLLNTCAESIDLAQYGIKHAKCIDDELFEKLLGIKLIVEKDKNQRLECGCIASIDIGMYNTCKNGCLYCYANYSKTHVFNNNAMHNPKSPILIGNISETDRVTERKVVSCKDYQIRLF